MKSLQKTIGFAISLGGAATLVARLFG